MNILNATYHLSRILGNVYKKIKNKNKPTKIVASCILS